MLNPVDTCKMNVSIVIPCLNEENNIGPCLESLVALDFPSDRMEIVISDGGSTDNTKGIIAQYQKKHSYIKLVHARKKWTSTVRNDGVQAAKYDYIGFVDADCEVPNQWLKTLAAGFLKYQSEIEGLVAVGGTNILPKGSKGFLKGLGIVLDSYLGSLGSIQGLILKKPSQVESLSTVNALYLKKKIEEIDGFDESLLDQGEDADLNFRLRQRGYRFMFIPNSFVRHKMRPTPKKWLGNMFRYGKARARLLKRYPAMRAPQFALPPLFLIALVLIPFARFSNWLAWPVLYFPLLLIYSLYQCLRKGAVSYIFIVYFCYLTTHIGYATGECYGLLSSKVK